MKKTFWHYTGSISVITGTIALLSAVGLKIYYVSSPQPAAVTLAAPTTTSILVQQASTTGQAPVVVQSPLFHYIEIADGCDWSYVGACVNMRSGPGLTYPIVGHLRTGVVLKVEATTTEADGHEWYKVIFDGEIRYPERVTGDWYVADDPESVQPFEDAGDSESTPGVVASTTKRIVVSRSEEMLYAYDGDQLFMKVPISTGLEFTPTPLGTFTVYKKTPSRYMQGPLPGVSDQYYDLPGVPWNLYFTTGGAVIHGAYWHDHFGQPWSHGCVNVPLVDEAYRLYMWAVLGTPVIVQQ